MVMAMVMVIVRVKIRVRVGLVGYGRGLIVGRVHRGPKSAQSWASRGTGRSQGGGWSLPRTMAFGNLLAAKCGKLRDEGVVHLGSRYVHLCS
jgi:hypothetical protein